MPVKVLVLDGEQRSSLAVVRSLGRAGYTIISGSCLTNSPAAVSRYCKKNYTYTSMDNPNRFIDDIQVIVKKEKPDILLPMTDLSVYWVLKYKDLFSDCSVCPKVSLNKFLQASNKYELLHMAKASAVPIPPTIFVKNFDEGKGISADLTYPVVLKSCFSWIPDGDKVVKGKVIIAENRKKYLEEIELHEAFKFPYMVQERLTGDGLGAFVLMHNGKVKVLFSHHRIREKPPWGGVSVVCESSPIERDIQLYSTILMENLDWNGVAMVEFKRHHKSGTPMLMEINARFWGSLQLAIDSGIDFPVLLIKQILGEEVEYPKTYTKSRMRWLIGDLDSLYILLTKRSPGLGTTQSLQKKIGGILDFSTEFFRSTCIEDFRYLDYKPFLKKIQTNYLKK